MVWHNECNIGPGSWETDSNPHFYHGRSLGKLRLIKKSHPGLPGRVVVRKRSRGEWGSKLLWIPTGENNRVSVQMHASIHAPRHPDFCLKNERWTRFHYLRGVCVNACGWLCIKLVWAAQRLAGAGADARQIWWKGSPEIHEWVSTFCPCNQRPTFLTPAAMTMNHNWPSWQLFQ